MQKRILVVEDDSQLDAAYKAKLEKEGYLVSIATTAQEGLDNAKKNKPDLILLDIMLPGGMNGFDFLERVRESSSLNDTPVILLTNIYDEQKTAQQIGVSDYLIKSETNLATIISKIKELTQSDTKTSHE